MQGRKAKGYAAMIIAVILWGSLYIFKGMIAEEIDAFIMVCIPAAIGSACLFLYNLAAKKNMKLTRKLMVQILISGALGIAAVQAANNVAIRELGASIPSVFMGAVPVVCYAVEIIMKKRAVTAPGVCGVSASFIGMALIVMGNGVSNTSFSLLGFGAILVVTVAWTWYSFYSGRLGCQDRITVLLLYQTFISMLVLLPLCDMGQLFGGIFTDGRAMLIMAAIGLMNVFAYCFFVYALDMIGVTPSNLLNNFMPVVTLILDFALFGKSLLGIQLFGTALIFVSVFVVCMADARKEKKENSENLQLEEAGQKNGSVI